MKGMHAIGVEIAGKIGGTAYTADDKYLMGLEAQLGAGPLEAVQNTKVTATWAPVRINLALEVPGRQLNRL